MFYVLLGIAIWCSIGAFLGGVYMTQIERSSPMPPIENIRYVTHWTFLWPFFLIAVGGSIFYDRVLTYNRLIADEKRLRKEEQDSPTKHKYKIYPQYEPDGMGNGWDDCTDEKATVFAVGTENIIVESFPTRKDAQDWLDRNPS